MPLPFVLASVILEYYNKIWVKKSFCKENPKHTIGSGPLYFSDFIFYPPNLFHPNLIVPLGFLEHCRLIPTSEHPHFSSLCLECSFLRYLHDWLLYFFQSLFKKSSKWGFSSITLDKISNLSAYLVPLFCLFSLEFITI